MNCDQGVEPVTMCLVCLRPALQHGCWFNCYPVLADWMNTVYTHVSLQYLTRGMAYVIIPHVVNFLGPIFTKFSPFNKFCSENGWVLIILTKFYLKIFPKCKIFCQSGPKNCFFLLIACSKFAPKSIHQIAWFQFWKYKFFSLWGEHIPLRHPLCTQVHNWHW